MTAALKKPEELPVLLPCGFSVVGARAGPPGKIHLLRKRHSRS